MAKQEDFTMTTLPQVKTVTSPHPEIVTDSDSRVLYERIVTNKHSGWLYNAQTFLKRLSDIVLSSVGLVAISPLLFLIAVAIKTTSKGPVFYKSIRIGRHHRPFYMFKFRTMAQNADDLREQLRKENNLEGNLFKIDNDPRITKVGHFLRDYSLDELPQLFNVFLGDMSLVGPRPLPEDESVMFKAPYDLRFRVLPGMTGLWQISGRSNLSFQGLCQLELRYILEWSVIKDLMILLKTFPVVLFKVGAC